LAIHDIAIFNAWLGEAPCAVQATGSVWLQPQPPYPSLRFAQGLADTVWARLYYPSGFQSNLHLSWLNPDKQRRLCVVGERGSLIFDELSDRPLSVQWGQLEQQGTQFLPVQQRQQELKVAKAEPLEQVCAHFITCVQTNRPSDISSGWLGAGLVKTLAALSESMQQGSKPIAISPFNPS
jgi:predicted dehydrogenase